jgi:hypothetical protein
MSGRARYSYDRVLRPGCKVVTDRPLNVSWDALRTNLPLLNETLLEDFQRVGRKKELGKRAHFVWPLVSVCSTLYRPT